jgi:peptide chain release factor subunit 1
MPLAIRTGMEKTTTALETPLREQLDRLSSFVATDAPVISLYLDMRPDQNGRANYGPFLRKAFGDRTRALKGDARKSFDRDVERITQYLDDVPPSTNGLAIFACAGAGEYFETVHLDTPIDQHWLFVGSVPHLFPLARINDQFPRYAALVVDTNAARLFVFGLGMTEKQDQVRNVKTRKAQMGGWSQARYQRHISNFHLHHMKEVVAVLDRVVREDRINQIVVACDEVARPTLFEHLPQHLVDKVVDVVNLDINAPEQQVLAETMDVLRQHDADTDAARVETLLGAWRAGGLGVVGPEDTLTALEMGQVEELLITATPDRLRRAQLPQELVSPGAVEVETSAAGAPIDAERIKLADELVTKAQQTSARIRFLEDPDLLYEVGGVGAILRFKI